MYEINKRRKKSKFKLFIQKVMTDVATKVLVASVITLGSAVLIWFNIFSDSIINQRARKICTADIDLFYRFDKIDSILKDLQARCGEKKCYTSRIALSKNKETRGYTAYIETVYGWHPSYNRVVSLKEFADANYTYFQRHNFDDASDVGLDIIQASKEKCISLTRQNIKVNGANYLDSVLSELKVPIGMLTACLGYNKFSELTFITLVTIREGTTANCGNCLVDVKASTSQMERLWNY